MNPPLSVPGRPFPRPARLVAAMAALLLVLAACGTGPRDIQIGAEECAHCRMLISEDRFAAQLVTDRGRHHVFDSIECMAEFLDRGEEVPEDRVAALWVTDFGSPGHWVAVEDAHFLRSEELRSPMGLNLSAHALEAAAREHRDAFGGEVLTWQEVRSLVATTPVRGGGGHAPHGGPHGH